MKTSAKYPGLVVGP